jgi:hypothetical protein
MRWIADLSRGLLGQLLIKLAALLSFCGGPLLVAELLEPALGGPGSFAVAFAPLAVVLYGALFLEDPSPARLDLAIVRVGLCGVPPVMGMNVYAVWHLATHPARPDRGLIVLGVVVGTLAAVFYTGLALRLLHRQERERATRAAAGYVVLPSMRGTKKRRPAHRR